MVWRDVKGGKQTGERGKGERERHGRERQGSEAVSAYERAWLVCRSRRICTLYFILHRKSTVAQLGTVENALAMSPLLSSTALKIGSAAGPCHGCTTAGVVMVSTSQSEAVVTGSQTPGGGWGRGKDGVCVGGGVRSGTGEATSECVG